MAEVNLLRNYPRSKRKITTRGVQKTERVRQIAREFGKDFFDGDRIYGYGGYTYHPRFWSPVIPDFQKHYHLRRNSRILDVGCAKGFMMHDFAAMISGIHVEGIDISQYAISHALPDMKAFIRVGNAKKLPFADKSFDLVISINTIHNLPVKECKKALKEIERVGKKAFITVDAYRNEKEKKRMEAWNLTAQTIFSTNEWINLFKEVGYNGDYYWFIP